jgi:hypothetical protein
MTIGLALVYDPRGHTFESWAALMCESYASQQLEMNVPEEKWKEFAVGLMNIAIFNDGSLPSPYAYDKWDNWAEEVVNVVNQARPNGLY